MANMFQLGDGREDGAFIAGSCVSGVAVPLGADQDSTGLLGIQPGTGKLFWVNEGLAGETGVQGQTGIQGIQGIQGVTGLRGLTGLQGQTRAQQLPQIRWHLTVPIHQ